MPVPGKYARIAKTATNTGINTIPEIAIQLFASALYEGNFMPRSFPKYMNTTNTKTLQTTLHPKRLATTHASPANMRRR